jgi:hypothetical protein
MTVIPIKPASTREEQLTEVIRLQDLKLLSTATILEETGSVLEQLGQQLIQAAANCRKGQS